MSIQCCILNSKCVACLCSLQGEEVFFSHLAAMHSEFILVQKTTGILYHWPYSVDTTATVNTDTDTQSTVPSDKTPSDVIPPASLHPLLDQFRLSDESVSLIAASDIRCTLVTNSGRVSTFYDKLLRGEWCTVIL